MKKVSTAAAKETKNLSQPKLAIGLDLGDRSSWYCPLFVVGDIVTQSISIESGAHIKGSIEVHGESSKDKSATAAAFSPK